MIHAVLMKITKIAIPMSFSTIVSMTVMLWCIRFLTLTDVTHLYIFALFMPVSYFIMAYCESFKSAMLVISSHSAAEQNREKWLVSIVEMILWVFLSVVLSVILFACFENHLAHWLCISNLFQQTFFRFTAEMLWLSSLVGITYLLSAVLFSAERSLSVMILLVFTAALNLLSTFVFSILLHLGLEGYVLSGLISYGLTILVAIILLQQSPLFNGITFKSLIHNYRLYRFNTLKYLKTISVPVGLSFSIIFLSVFLFNKILSHFGEDILSGFSVAYRIQAILLMPAIAIGTATAIFMNKEKMSSKTKSFYDSVVFQVGMSISLFGYAIMASSVFILKNALVSVMTHIPVVEVYATEYLKQVSPSYVGMGPLLTWLTVLEQTGYGILSLGMNILYFGLLVFLGGSLAIYHHNFRLFYENITFVNLGVLFLMLSGFCLVHREKEILC